MDKSKLPREWNGKTLETAFYINRKNGTFMFIEQEGSNFFISTLDEPGRRKLLYLDGQHKPYDRVDPDEYLAQQEEEIRRKRAFVQSKK
jgi:hypothetical protein